ncbi:MAG TPA: 2-phosphosulfolactate phosphatase [Dehalococcoidia bacterium]|nr:2-phosphosulfolactate phosphatase [Dehalococcoidia bacterium]
MRLHVALLPNLIQDARSAFAVVDVLRASTTIVTLLERGAPAVIPALGVEEARALHERLPGHILCGEQEGLPPPGFDYGNSPAELAAAALDGRPVILATSNGTRILNDLADAPAVLVGALVNREAAAEALLALAAEHGCDATIVCAAAPSGRSIALEDALGAGAIAEAALRLDPSLQPTDAAMFARDAFLAAAGDLRTALASARHGAELIAAGFAADVEHCARLDVSTAVPVLQRDGDGLLALRALGTAG